jgi:ABC-type multidrug transport system fused ATPase/permease subunit
MMQNKLGFIVTHRMAFAQLADRVLVMDGGQLVEIGNHKQLLNTCEKYRQLWFSQADIYVK